MIYYYFPMDNQIWVMTLYGKGEVADLSAAERRALKAVIDKETTERARRARRK